MASCDAIVTQDPAWGKPFYAHAGCWSFLSLSFIPAVIPALLFLFFGIRRGLGSVRPDCFGLAAISTWTSVLSFGVFFTTCGLKADLRQ